MENTISHQKNTQNQRNLRALRQIFPDCVHEIVDPATNERRLVADMQRLAAVLGARINSGDEVSKIAHTTPRTPENLERYQLDWPGKRAARTHAAAECTKYLSTRRQSSVDFEQTGHLFIEGDNLDALKLLGKTHKKKVKLIYIDPPYNTGKDFVYSDNFREDPRVYQARLNQTSMSGAGPAGADPAGAGPTEADPKEHKGDALDGRRHAAWLSMILPRLICARALLRDDGFIFISIDDHEYANLKLVCDEVFGESNFVTTFMWRRKKEVSNDSKNVAVQAEYLLCYARSDEARLANESLSVKYLQQSYRQPTSAFPDGLWRPVPLTVSRGLSGGGYEYAIEAPSGKIHHRLWAWPEHRFRELRAAGRVYFGKKGNALPQRVIYAHESKGRPTTNFWSDIATNKEGKKEILALFGENIFDTPKPTELIIKIMQLACGPDDLVLDFFAGSATTAHAVLKLNARDGGARRFIMVQTPEPLPAPSHNARSRRSSRGRSNHGRKSARRFSNIAALARARLKLAGEALLAEDHHPDWSGDIGFRHLVVEASAPESSG